MLFLSLLILLLAAPAYSSSDAVVGMFMINAASPTGTCYGWPTTNCVPDSNPTSSAYIDASPRRYFRLPTETLSANCTITSVSFYVGANYNEGAATNYASVYDWASGDDMTGVCYGQINDAAINLNSWNTVSMTTGDCSKSASDVVGIILHFDDTQVSIGREDSGGSGLNYLTSAWSGVPTDIYSTFTLSSGRDMAMYFTCEE